MAIRLRIVDGKWLAVCAACTVEKSGDVYINDGQHGALSDKFSRDFNDMHGCDLPFDPTCALLAEIEESNNPAREWWDKEYGNDGQDAPPGHIGIVKALEDVAAGRTKSFEQVRAEMKASSLIQ